MRVDGRTLIVLGALAMGCGEEAPARPIAEPGESAPAPSIAEERSAQPAPSTASAPASHEAPAAPEPSMPPVEPLVSAEVPVPDEGPRLVPALRAATRIGAGPWLDDLTWAIGAGFVDFDAGEDLEVVRELDHRTLRFVLATAPPREVPARHERAAELRSIWLAGLERREVEGEVEHRRVAAILLYDGALASEPLTGEGTMAPFACTIESELRARDVDGDRELEVTVIAAFLRPTQESWQGGGSPDECGAVAFIVGAGDWNVQAAFTREYAVQAFAASIEVGERREAAWQLRDLDGDGHADLRVAERWRWLDSFMGDYVGGGETAAADRRRGSDRREVDCLYVVAHDAWRCPEPAPGRLLFEDPRARGERRGIRPW